MEGRGSNNKTIYLYKSFIHQRTGSKVKKKKKHRKQTQINLTNMQLYPNFTAKYRTTYASLIFTAELFLTEDLPENFRDFL